MEVDSGDDEENLEEGKLSEDNEELEIEMHRMHDEDDELEDLERKFNVKASFNMPKYLQLIFESEPIVVLDWICLSLTQSKKTG